ncbi:glycosyltransferase [Amycolatopsis jiangsuensis]|uniref:UDP:flavonoid glycosyltransferase YjiC (YdhE family) n=1 Tax=Amycolatopsis jiangsuensis TaxID=1181879 RepID=A0A840J4C1_9PSEU|nr:nucleotide disphospho-sugar-binding domain-containing protein [Amycolatopsis jiangsuensis]MBB4688703.1 UDP:flavonoid glycosyltransferase YjiC (YdhE family) [Amycolatopsis jiangsuensis]
MRFLFVVPPLAGHVTPLRGVAAVLTGRGHEVRWCGPEPETSSLVGGPVHAAGDSATFVMSRCPSGLRGIAALRYRWKDYLIPLADAMMPGVSDAVACLGPDVVVADQHTFAGAVAATRSGVPWVTSAPTSTELGDPLAALPKIAGWTRALQDELCARHGIAARDLRFSPDLVLAFTTPELAGPPAVPGVRYVGPAPPSFSDREFPWERLDGRPLVVVALGADVEEGKRFLRESAAALSALPVQSLVVDPTGTVDVDGVVVRQRIPRPEVLSGAAAVVCHGGHTTVCASLAAGLPLVVAPIRDDQTVLAEQVVRAGTGVRIRFDQAGAEDIRAAVTAVLEQPRYRAAADRVRGSFRASDGVIGAADALEVR